MNRGNILDDVSIQEDEVEDDSFPNNGVSVENVMSIFALMEDEIEYNENDIGDQEVYKAFIANSY